MWQERESLEEENEVEAGKVCEEENKTKSLEQETCESTEERKARAKEEREYEKVFNLMSTLVEKGELTVGSRLPAERTIAQELSISRNSTREAIRMLENMGAVESRQGSGNYISGNMKQGISQMIRMMLLLNCVSREDICAFRRSMEKAVCNAAMGNPDGVAFLEEAERILERWPYKEAEEKQETEDDCAFHYCLIKATGNSFWVILMEAVSVIYREWIDKVLKAADQKTKARIYLAHCQMITALKKKDHKACEKAVDLHYDLIEEQLVRENI